MITRKEALEYVNNMWMSKETHDALEALIPEFGESEDERIRKFIQKLLITARDTISNSSKWEQYNDALAWLEKQKEQKPLTIESVYEKFVNPETLKEARINKYIRAQLLWELMHNGIITEVDYQYLTDDKRKPWTVEEYRIAYQKGFEMSEQLKQKEQKPIEWKPQAESLEALMYAVEGNWDMIKPTSYLSRRLEDLYEGLVNTFNVDESYLHKLSEVAYTAEDIEELKALKNKIEASMEQKEQKPVSFSRGHENDFTSKEWGEEDEHRRKDAIYFLETAKAHYADTSEIEATISWLKSLPLRCPKSSDNWKPSEEQMEALKECGECKRCIKELYEQLLKLGVKEEPEYYQHFDPDC